MVDTTSGSNEPSGSDMRLKALQDTQPDTSNISKTMDSLRLLGAGQPYRPTGSST